MPQGVVWMKVPVLSAATPQRGNGFSHALGRGFLTLFKWRFEGEFPGLNKAMVIVVPHTSGWDFYVGMSAMLAIGLRISWFGKQSLFKFPLGGVMRWLGGIPVNRDRAHGVIPEAVDAFSQREQLILGLAPEGTRRHVKKWKMGFYHIAHKANVPVMMMGFDYKKRAIVFGPHLYTTGDRDTDIAQMRAFFATIHGKNRQMI
jgi:1-acyl-sn-glycerol-3-phosphate acyltransferase